VQQLPFLPGATLSTLPAVALGAFQSNSGQPYVNPVGWCGEWAAMKNSGSQ